MVAYILYSCSELLQPSTALVTLELGRDFYQCPVKLIQPPCPTVATKEHICGQSISSSITSCIWLPVMQVKIREL